MSDAGGKAGSEHEDGTVALKNVKVVYCPFAFHLPKSTQLHYITRNHTK